MSPIDRIAHDNRWRDRALAEKATLALGLLGLAVTLPPWPTAAVVLTTTTLAAILGARVSPGLWLGLVAAPAGFALVGAATLVVSIDGSGLGLAPGGVAATAGLIGRALAASSALLLLAVTTPATDLVGGLRRLGLPDEFAEIALLTHRFLFVLADTARAMDAAQAARLGRIDLRRRLTSLGGLAGNLLPRALDRARRLEVGLSARGWNGPLATLAPTRRPASPGGLAAVAAILAGVALLAWIGR